MQTKDLDGQVMLFDPDLPCGKTSSAATQAPLTERRPTRTSRQSSSRSSRLKNHRFMLLDLRPGAGNMLGPYWEYDPAWLGPPGRLNFSECPKGAVDASLSAILVATVPSKYYLSRTACRGILRRAEERNKPLPPQLELALKLQAGIVRPPPGIPISALLRSMAEEETAAGLLMAFAANQRDEVRDLHDIAGALGAQSIGAPMRAQRSGSYGERSRSEMSEGYGACGDEKQQTFVANCLNPWDTQQARVFTPDSIAPTLASADGGGGRNPGGLVYTAGFSANAGSKAGSTGYDEEISPTLKGTQSGGMMPSILCLNDQGGSVMSCSEDIAGTLRAQEHGHQPLIFENHGVDARYKGPLSVAPTLPARAGTGGNNLSLVLQEPGTLCISGNAIDRKPHNGGNGLGIQEYLAYTLTATDHHAVFARQRVDGFQESDVVSTESARRYKDATDLVLQPEDDSPAFRLIRRLVPQECELLQGYPPGWTDLPGASDSVRFKALGNSVAIPCVEYLMQGIALVLRTGL